MTYSRTFTLIQLLSYSNNKQDLKCSIYLCQRAIEMTLYQ